MSAVDTDVDIKSPSISPINEPMHEINEEHTSHPYVTKYNIDLHNTRHTKFHNEEMWEIEEREMLRKFMIDRNIEIIALLEGQDALTGL